MSHQVQRAELTLDDGTRVCLNSNTTLTFPDHFDRKERRVTLDGEGYFQVAKNEKKPFIVQAKEYEVRVLGTEFNVMMYKDQDFFEISLAERLGRSKRNHYRQESKTATQRTVIRQSRSTPEREYQRVEPGIMDARNPLFRQYAHGRNYPPVRSIL